MIKRDNGPESIAEIVALQLLAGWGVQLLMRDDPPGSPNGSSWPDMHPRARGARTRGNNEPIRA